MSKLTLTVVAAHLILIATAAACLCSLASGPRPAAPGVTRAPVNGAGAPGSAVRRIAGPWRAESVRVVDGDTFEARLRIWFNQDVTLLVRLEGVDAPEIRGRCPQERRLAEEAREALGAILASGEVFVRDLHADKYNGRAVGRASVVEARGGGAGDDVGAMLLAGGYARAYDGRARSPWCGASAALAEARRAR